MAMYVSGCSSMKVFFQSADRRPTELQEQPQTYNRRRFRRFIPSRHSTTSDGFRKSTGAGHDFIVSEARAPVLQKLALSQNDEGRRIDHRLKGDLLQNFLDSRGQGMDSYGSLRSRDEPEQVSKGNHDAYLENEDALSSIDNVSADSGNLSSKNMDSYGSSRSRDETEEVRKGSHYAYLENEDASSSIDNVSVDSGSFSSKIIRLAQGLPHGEQLEDHLDVYSEEINADNGNLLMQILGEKKLVVQALSLFQWMRMHDPCILNSRSYSVIFRFLGQEGLSERALLLFQNMPQGNMYHCVNVYNSLIAALLACNRSHEALEVLKQFKGKGIEPDSVTFSLLMTATRKGAEGGLKGTWNVFKLVNSTQNAALSIFAFGTLLKAFCDEGLQKEGLLLVIEMEKLGIPPNVVIYNTLIDAYGKSGELGEAEGLFSEMVAKGLHPNEATYNALINAYGRMGQYEVAEALLKEMFVAQLAPNVITYTAIMNAYAKQKQSLKAANVFLRMKNDGVTPNAYAYTVLIHAYSEGRWHEKAALAFENMKMDGVKPTVETYTALLDGFRQAGDVEKVKAIWKEMRESGCPGTRITFNTLVDSFAKKGLYSDVRNVIHEFGKLGLTPDQMTYNMLINAYARGGQHEQTPNIVKEMRAAGFTPDSYTYSTLIYAFVRVRDFAMALKYHGQMCKADQLPDFKSYRKMKAILDAKLGRQLGNDKKANLGQLWKQQAQCVTLKKLSWRKTKKKN